MKTCQLCGARNASAATVCSACDTHFPDRPVGSGCVGCLLRVLRAALVAVLVVGAAGTFAWWYATRPSDELIATIDTPDEWNQSLALSPIYPDRTLLVAVGAVFIISFMSVGKNLRPRLSFSAWMTLAYGGAGVWAAAGVFIMKAPIVGYPAESYGWLVALIIITTGIGHAALNYVLPYVRLFTVNLATVAEPVIAIGASMLFLAETVTSAEVIGGGLLTAAMFVGMRDEWKPRRELPELETG